MAMFGRSAKRALRPEDVRGSLDLSAARDAALLEGIRVVGIRVEADGEPVDGRRDAASRALGSDAAGMPLRSPSGHFGASAAPAVPTWAEQPDDPSAYPHVWEVALRRFVRAF